MIVKDQMGVEVILSPRPVKVVSIVPSLTEYLVDLGIEVVGRTRSCIHPKGEVDGITIVGSTKKLNHNKIAALKPDIIIGCKEENTKDDIDLLRKNYPVWMADIYSLDDSKRALLDIAWLVGKENEGKTIIDKWEEVWGGKETVPFAKVLYLIWKSPYMAVASNNYINSVMEYFGFENCLKHQDRYPVLLESEIKKMNPEIIFLSSEPFPFKEEHIPEFRQIFPNSKVIVVDGEAFSWYGTRQIKRANYLKDLAESLKPISISY